MIALAEYFVPLQVGVGVSGGCEAAVHAARRFLSGMPEGWVMVKLDVSNVFKRLLGPQNDPGGYRFAGSGPSSILSVCHASYAAPSSLIFREFEISSEEGIQQRDPLGPLLFCLCVQPLLESIIAPELSMGRMDPRVGSGRVRSDRVITSDFLVFTDYFLVPE